MDIQGSVIAVLRMINKIKKEEGRAEVVLMVGRYARILNEAEKAMLVKVIKSMTLLTSGRVDWIRNPEQFRPEPRSLWRGVLSSISRIIIEGMQPDFDANSEVLKEDYELANKLLPFLGQTSLDAAGFQSGARSSISDEDRQDPDFIGHDVLYRGMHGMTGTSKRWVQWLMTLPDNWSIQRGVSTSSNRDRSMTEFAMANYATGIGSKDGPAIFFTIKNPNRKGFIADNLTVFNEEEIILSGIIDVESFRMTAEASIRYSDGPSGFNTKVSVEYKSDGNILTISLPMTSMISNLDLSSDFPKKIDLSGQDLEAIHRTFVSGRWLNNLFSAANPRNPSEVKEFDLWVKPDTLLLEVESTIL